MNFEDQAVEGNVLSLWKYIRNVANDATSGGLARTK